MRCRSASPPLDLVPPLALPPRLRHRCRPPQRYAGSECQATSTRERWRRHSTSSMLMVPARSTRRRRLRFCRAASKVTSPRSTRRVTECGSLSNPRKCDHHRTTTSNRSRVTRHRGSQTVHRPCTKPCRHGRRERSATRHQPAPPPLPAPRRVVAPLPPRPTLSPHSIRAPITTAMLAMADMAAVAATMVALLRRM